MAASSPPTPPAPTSLPDFEPLVGPYLAHQDWVQSVLGTFGRPTVTAEIVDVELLRDELPGLASVVASSNGETFHLVLGWRELTAAPAVLGMRPNAVLGPAHDGRHDVLVYDALADDELLLEVLSAASSGAERAARGRVVQSLVSHSALIYDDRLFMKCYRVIESRSRPEIETALRLVTVGFDRMLAPVAHWQRNGRDLGLVRQFVPGALEGKALALTSLRDLFGRAEPGEAGRSFEQLGLAGGDLGPEMRRLGETTAELHLALAEAFGSDDAAGIRVHGDYHLRRVMRTDRGWVVAGFGDDPLLGADAGTASTGEPVKASPLEDLADFCYSLRQAAAEAAALQPPSTRRHALELAASWEHHNAREFTRGYRSNDGIGRFVPDDPAQFDAELATLVASRAEGMPNSEQPVPGSA